MHHSTQFEASDLARPELYAGHSSGYLRSSHIDRDAGAIHTGIATCELAPGGGIDEHAHSYEEFVYVLSGRPVISLGGTSVELAPEEGAFVAVGEAHSMRNQGPEPCRWIEFQTPQARAAGAPPDTFFTGAGSATETAQPLDVRNPLLRSFCRWTPAQMDLDVLKVPSPVDAPAVSASMSSALLAYAGITVKMLLDERHGASQGNVFMVDYYPGVVLHPHDHPFEEAFYMLEGEVAYIADGEEYTLRPGDVAYAGVGCIHAFENRTDRRCRWLETRSPAPPARHAYRFERDWAALR